MKKIFNKILDWFYFLEENRQKKLKEADQISIDYYSSPSYLALQEAIRKNKKAKLALQEARRENKNIK